MRIQLDQQVREEGGAFESFKIEWEQEDMVYLFSSNAFDGEQTPLQAKNMKEFELLALRRAASTANDAAFHILEYGGLGDDGTDETYNDLEIVNYLGWTLYESPESLVEYANTFATYCDVDTRKQFGRLPQISRQSDYQIASARNLLDVLEQFAERDLPQISPDDLSYYLTWGRVINFLLNGR